MPSLAVILAAGTGSRLAPETDRTPKCLLRIGERTLLDRLLDRLAQGGVERVVAVVGHLADRVSDHVARARTPLDVRVVVNAAYATTNNAMSLLAVREAVGDAPFLLCDGDLVLPEGLVGALRRAPEPCTLVVDPASGREPEQMKVEIDRAGHVRAIAKTLDPERSAGESIGLQKIGGAALPRLWTVLQAMARDRRQAWYEEAFQALVDEGVVFRALIELPGPWIEIDDRADLARARDAFAR